MTVKEIFGSNTTKYVLISLGAIIVVLVIFQIGLLVGYRKADFSGRIGNHYFELFGHERGGRGFRGVQGMMGMHEFASPHGVIGTVVKLDPPTMIIDGDDHIEKNIVLQNDTIVRSERDTVPSSTLMVGDRVLVLGSPDDRAEIQAKFIRILETPNQQTTTSSTVK